MRIQLGEEVSMLTTVYVSDFGDNYHRTDDEPSTELEKAARRIRRRYKNITEYMQALGVYQEYMALLALKHGGPVLFKLKLKNEAIEDFVPAKPRMKNTAHNKMLLKKGIMVSRVNLNKVDRDKLSDTIETNVDEDQEHIIADTKTKDPVALKLIKEGHFDRVRVGRVAAISNIDFLEEYFRSKNSKQKEEVEEELQSVSLTDIASGAYEDKIQDTSEQDDVIYYRGNYMSRQAVEDLKIYQDLGAFGWNSIKIMKEKGVSKRITNIVKEQNKMSKKKKKKDSKKKGKSDDFLVSVMMDNDHDSFANYEQDMLNFTADNIFGQ